MREEREEREGKSEEKTAALAPATRVPPAPVPLVDLAALFYLLERLRHELHPRGFVGVLQGQPQSIFETVAAYGDRIGVRITPHDLRRTFAKLAHQGRAPLEQIQISLGHASIQTTERYLGLRQNLHDAPCDRLGLVGWEEA